MRKHAFVNATSRAGRGGRTLMSASGGGLPAEQVVVSLPAEGGFKLARGVRVSPARPFETAAKCVAGAARGRPARCRWQS